MSRGSSNTSAASAALAISALDTFSANALQFGVQEESAAAGLGSTIAALPDRDPATYTGSAGTDTRGEGGMGIPPLPCNPDTWGSQCALGVVASSRAGGWNTSSVIMARAGMHAWYLSVYTRSSQVEYILHTPWHYV